MPSGVYADGDVYRFYQDKKRHCRANLCHTTRQLLGGFLKFPRSIIIVFFLLAAVKHKPARKQKFCWTSFTSLLSDLRQFRFKVGWNGKKLASLGLSFLCQPSIKMQTPTPK